MTRCRSKSRHYRAVGVASLVWSGKGNDVAIIPSPKNRTGGFLHIRLKPFIPPV
jgi:hypothetical protein